MDQVLLSMGSRKGFIVISPTLLCNNNCIFCYENYRDNAFRAVPSVDELFDRTIGLARSTGLSSVAISGGEPTLYTHLTSYVRALTEAGISVCLLTNGRTMADENRLRELVEAGVGHFHIPLHADQEDRHDATTRSQGSFRQALAGIQNIMALRRESIFKFSIVQVVHTGNVKRLAAFIDFAARFMPDYILFSSCIVENESPKSQQELLVPFQETVDALKAALPAIVAADMPVYLENVPPCAMRGLETMCLDFHKYNRLRVHGLKAAGDRGLPSFEGLEQSIKSRQRARPVPCGRCVLEPFCGGVYRSHLAAFGHDDLRPFSMDEMRAMIQTATTPAQQDTAHA